MDERSKRRAQYTNSQLRKTNEALKLENEVLKRMLWPPEPGQKARSKYVLQNSQRHG